MRVKASRPPCPSCQRADDLVHVAAGAEVAAGAGDHHHLDVRVEAQRAEQVAQLGVGLEGERVLALRPVQRDRGDLAVDLPEEVPGGVGGQVAHVSFPNAGRRHVA